MDFLNDSSQEMKNEIEFLETFKEFGTQIRYTRLRNFFLKFCILLSKMFKNKPQYRYRFIINYFFFLGSKASMSNFYWISSGTGQRYSRASILVTSLERRVKQRIRIFALAFQLAQEWRRGRNLQLIREIKTNDTWFHRCRVSAVNHNEQAHRR